MLAKPEFSRMVKMQVADNFVGFAIDVLVSARKAGK
jgi:hypothetical protein